MILDDVEAAGFPVDCRRRWLAVLDFIEAVHMVPKKEGSRSGGRHRESLLIG